MEIKTTLGRVVLCVIVSVMLILIQNSGAFALVTFSGRAVPLTFTQNNANAAQILMTKMGVPLFDRAPLIQPCSVVQQNVDFLQ